MRLGLCFLACLNNDVGQDDSIGDDNVFVTIAPVPPVGLLRTEVATNPRFRGELDVTPVFDRDPSRDWCAYFRQACEAAPDLEWKGAGFIRCTEADVDLTTDRLREFTEIANHRFEDFLRRAEARQQSQVQDQIILEGISSVSADVGGYYGHWV